MCFYGLLAHCNGKILSCYKLRTQNKDQSLGKTTEKVLSYLEKNPKKQNPQEAADG